MVRSGQISRGDAPAECSDEMLADLLATTRSLEFVNVEVHGDRRSSVHLPLQTNRVEAALGEM